jgi:hypothetical protein
MEMTLLPPGTPPDTSIALPQRGRLRWLLSRVRGYSHVQPPPVGPPIEQGLYGFAQPILGARILLADMQLLREALYPGLVLALVCAGWASIHHDPGKWGWFAEFYKAFAALAPLPSVIFANHYARLAAIIRWRLGFGACGPREMPLGMLMARLLRQAGIVAIGVAPIVGILNAIPFLGQLLSGAILAVWGLHWVIADAFDDAQVCLPGESLKQSIDRDRNAPQPWFVRWLNFAADRIPIGRGIVRRFAKLCDKLALDSRGEIEIMENNRSISLGFGLSTAALMAIPGLNLLFRPIILASASHLVGQIESGEGHHGAHELPEHQQ